MKTLAFAASNSRNSINKALVTYAAKLLSEQVMETEIDLVDLNDFAAPLYSIDIEMEDGIPQAAKDLKARIAAADQVLISLAEHNGSYTAAYKSIFDWMSRLEGKVYEGKPIVLLSTSPGGRGGASVKAQASASIPFFGGEVKASLSVPGFGQVFDTAKGELTDPDLHAELLKTLAAFKAD
ncbi:MAG: NAD(P)H-dependent oxidoreductase [Alphaproteobacteria bacterium]|nr:NAD(P)H-dependent oxidoreductase [Alphaproteobacteria bacterium]